MQDMEQFMQLEMRLTATSKTGDVSIDLEKRYTIPQEKQSGTLKDLKGELERDINYIRNIITTNSTKKRSRTAISQEQSGDPQPTEAGEEMENIESIHFTN